MLNFKNIKRETLEFFYLKMEEIRQFEQKSVELYQAGELPGFLHSCLGQEAAAVGMVAALNPEDFIVTTHRGHGHIIAKGADMKRMMAELYAKQTGYCRGKGGSMHIMDRNLNILGANGIVGQGATLGTGAGITAMLKNSNQVSVCFLGDGAQNEGFFHESLNLASIWNLPVVYAVENNGYAESTPQTYHMRPENIARRADGYDIASFIADGNDVTDVYRIAQKAVATCRKGKGPVLIELKTYRWLGHYVGDPGVYRPKKEVEHWRNEMDPIERFRHDAIDLNIFTAEVLDEIRSSVAVRIEEAVAFGKASDPLPPESALEDVYQDGLL
jgi:pyruvate dehydrogenase E1 component alpha subunit